jgi:allantoin racemase
MHVLIINPNTRSALTTQLVEQLSPYLAGTGIQVMSRTAAFGHDYIASEASYVLAAHAVLNAWHEHLRDDLRPRAVLVACFGDPGVWALRGVAGVPVIGLAEASMREAMAHGPFGIVTGGKAWGPMLERLARGWQLNGRTPEQAGLQRVRTVEAHGGELMADPQQGLVSLGAAVNALLDDGPPLRAVILGGAALGGWAQQLPVKEGVALIDNVEAGGRWLAEQMAG